MEYPEISQVYFSNEDIEQFTQFDCVSFHNYLTNPKKFDYLRFETDLQLCPRCQDGLITGDELLCDNCESDIFNEVF